MKIQLQFLHLSDNSLTQHAYDSELDDIRSLLVDLCRHIEKPGKFIVSGFGQSPWPVDVGTDLPVFLEQLPEAIKSVNSREPFQLDFYEQGIERTIIFTPFDGLYVALCKSYSNWQPCPDTEQIDCGELQEMLETIRSELIKAIHIVAPILLENAWLKCWADIA